MLRDVIRLLVQALYERIRVHMLGRDDTTVGRGKAHKKRRLYIYNPAYDRGARRITLLIGAALVLVFTVSAVNLVGYGVDYLQSRRASNELRQSYYQQTESEPETASPAPTMTEMPTVTPEAETATPGISATPMVTPGTTPIQHLAPVKYPGNPYNIVSNRFQKLKRQNDDIIGWIKIEGMLDEAVVQRDNRYYLDRDYRGYHNVNGAIFLDEYCDLRTRPYTMMLYGHNMKSGLMFGALRNYENPTYYHNNPFITFDTAYEDGRYVIFSVATISLDEKNWRYVNLAWLLSSSVSLRSKAISSLNRFSVYDSSIDVQPEDQLLLLITCVDDLNERRIITARRIREDETEEELHKQVRRIRMK